MSSSSIKQQQLQSVLNAFLLPERETKLTSGNYVWENMFLTTHTHLTMALHSKLLWFTLYKNSALVYFVLISFLMCLQFTLY